MRLTMLTMVLGGCVVARHPTQPAAQAAAQTPIDVVALLAQPGPIRHEAVVSARWEAKLSGLLDLDHPVAASAGLLDGRTPILLPVHVLDHPDAGLFVVDTGVDASLAGGGRGPVRGLLRGFTRSLTPEEPLGAVLARRGRPLAGVLLTHLHVDHVLGLPDVPVGSAIYAGEGETTARAGQNALLRRTYNAAFAGHAPIQTWDRSRAVAFGPVERAWDVTGDGSLWALDMPGHTPGSTAYLARTVDGPVLFAGDTCHTLWGWENAVPPGGFTADAAQNMASLSALKALQELVPSLTVYVGHELDGRGTGVDDTRR